MLWLGVLLLAQTTLKAYEINTFPKYSTASSETLKESKYPAHRPDEEKNRLETTHEELYEESLKHFLQNCSQYLCNASLEKVCSCDKNCYKDSNCCPDALDDGAVEILLYTDVWGCVSMNGQHPVSMINKCPRSCTDSTTCRLCEEDPGYSKDQRVILPVTNPNNNYTYKNIYCAQCNEGKTQIRFETRFKCKGPNTTMDGQVAFQLYLHNESCMVNLVDKQTCKDEEGIISTCSDTWSPNNRTFAELTRWRCSKVFAPITVSGKAYRNAYCAICHYEIPASERTVCNVVQEEEVDIFKFCGQQEELQNFLNATNSLCLSEEVYDPFRRQCRPICEILATKAEDEHAADSLSSEKNQNCESPPLQSPPCKKIILDGPEFKLEDNGLVYTNASGYSVRYEAGEFEIANDSFGNFAVVCASSTPKRTRALCIQNYCSSRISGFSSCTCDAACLLNGTCCLDVFPDEDMSNRIQQDKWECTRGNRSVVVISKCPPSPKEEDHVKRLCETYSPLHNEPLLHLPVISESDQIVYRNIFCAKCHQVPKTVSFETEFQCRQLAAVPNAETALEHFLKNDGVCNISFSVSEGQVLFVPLCQTAGCRLCSESWHHSNKTYEGLVRWKCDNYLAPAYINGTCYKNEFCVICNGIDPRYETVDCGLSKKGKVNIGEFSTESVLFIVG